MTTNKKTIYRKDIISGEVFPRDELLRLVYIDGHIEFDTDLSKPGRGAYIKKDEGSLEALKNGKLLSRAFKVKVKEEDIKSLYEGK